MDPIAIESVKTILELINAGGVTALLIGLIMLFLRGDIIPRKVYERLLRDLLSKIAADIIAAVTELLKEQNDYTEQRIDSLYERFNHIEECIEESRHNRL